MKIRHVLVTGAALAALFGTSTAAHAINMEYAVRYTNHSYGSSVQEDDIAAALDRIGHNYGRSVDDGDKQVLLDWGAMVEKAVITAKDQEGDRYRYGGNGPDEFDCSGLTSYAWRAAGIELPRSSRDQAAYTRSVPRSDIRLGDLLFYGSPVHHTAIYIGNGQAVEASRSGVPVRITDDALTRRDLVKIGRPY